MHQVGSAAKRSQLTTPDTTFQLADFQVAKSLTSQVDNCKIMVKTPKIGSFLFAIFTSLSLARTVEAGQTTTLTVVVDGVRNHNGQVCMRIFSGAPGFPFSDTSEVQSGCTQITGSTVAKKFYGLKPGTYAVAVLDDENGDHKLHRDLLGIPQEGFGVSNNPTVSVKTGAPKFKDASFLLKQDATIRVVMKYSLDQ